jgi:hypothetical protein
VFVLGPGDVLDFEWDWSLWLPTGDTIASAAWTPATGLTVANTPAASNTTTAATVWIDGGTQDGVLYTLSCQITTAAGRVAEAMQDVAVHSDAPPSSSRVYQVPVVL